MKKFALAFLSIIISSPAFANIHINGKVATAVIKEQVPADRLYATLRAYNDVLKQSGGGSTGNGISAAGLWNVCAAAGWDIKQVSGKNSCKTFVSALLKKGMVTYKEVCGDDKGKTGPNSTEYCITDFKTVRVNQTPALEIAKMYACIKHKDCSLQCSTKHRTSWNDDYIKCTSQNKPAYYEFQFDSVDNSIDHMIRSGIQTAVCKIHDAPATTSGAVGGDISLGATCAADATKCKEINKSLSKFGYAAEYKNGKCNINFNTICDAKDLKTAFGIDSFEPCKWGWQAKNATDLEKQIKNFIAGKAGVSAAAIRCEAGFKTYTGAGCKVNGITDLNDDVKTCYVNGQQIDLVFDDINETWKDYHDDTIEGLRCVIQGGNPSGERCIGLGQQQCEMIRQAQLSDCPECKLVYWDAQTQSCVTPAGAAANNLRRGVNITLIIGGAAVGVVVTVAAASAAAAAAAAAGTAAVAATAASNTVAFVLTGIETVGAGIELTSQLKIDGVADKFLIESNKCNDPSCARELINMHLQRLSRMMNDMTTPEIRTIDNEMARLIELIPTDSDWWVTNLKRDDGQSFLEFANDDAWEPEQIWRAFGIGLQLTGMVTAVGKWILTKTSVMEKFLDRTSRILLRNARIAKANIVDPSKLSGADMEWYKLWQEYAPKNQTLTEFKAMTDGNLDEMKQMAKNWTSRSALRAKNQAQNKLNRLMDEYEIDALPSDPEELAALYKKHPDLKVANEQLDKFANVSDDVDNYSTFDPEMERLFRKYNQAQKELDDWWNTEYNKELDRFVKNGGDSFDFGLSEQYENLKNRYDQQGKALRSLVPSQWELAEKFSLKNVANVADERAREFADIIADNPGIKLQMDQWRNLTDDQRLSVARQIMDEYSAKYGTPPTQVWLDYDTKMGGYYRPGTNQIYLNPNAQFQSPYGMIETLSHEHAHLIDNLAPNQGALGAQYSHYGTSVYSNRKKDGYRVALTEQSSYKIGPAAEKEVAGVTNQYVGTEYRLTQAGRELETLNTVAEGLSAAAPGGGTVGTIVVKAPVKEIIKDKLGIDEEKNDNKR